MVNKVTVIHRRDRLRATKILQERAFASPNMEFRWNAVVEEIRGNGDMDHLLLRDLKTNQQLTMRASGIFIYIGFLPNSQFLSGLIPMDPGGHVASNILMETEIPGVLVCGDVRQHSDRQLGTAVGDGITAALSAYRYITEG